jgi:hypothetical protein
VSVPLIKEKWLLTHKQPQQKKPPSFIAEPLFAMRGSTVSYGLDQPSFQELNVGPDDRHELLTLSVSVRWLAFPLPVRLPNRSVARLSKRQCRSEEALSHDTLHPAEASY